MMRGETETVVWRLIQLETHDAFVNMAIDEAIFKARIQNLVPNTLRLYRWKPSAVSIGRFQKVENEVQLDNCKRLGVDVVRRITGGGTVYHDAEDEVTYSVVVSKKDLGTEDITAVYARIYAGLAEALKTLGMKADFCEGNTKTCPNLTVNGKKISGSAQSHRMGVVLQHGTLLANVDLQRMFTLLRVPWANTCMEVVDVAKRKITSIKEELGTEIPLEEVRQALIRGFKNALNMESENCSELTTYEHALAEKLYKEKYATDDWNSQGKSILEE
jgi:lipoate-protein ligase A